MPKVITILLSILLLAAVAKSQQTGTIKDNRDGKIYKTVKIGNQIWMAENLKYKTKEGSWCCNDSSFYCDKYGRLYDWETAKKVCPQGYHLPTQKEFEILKEAVNNDANSLKAIGQGIKEGVGTNTSGFNALLVGARDYNGIFYYSGIDASFWSSTESKSNGACGLYLYYEDSEINLDYNYKKYGYSVRCLKN